jgi:hypothetical protein
MTLATGRVKIKTGHWVAPVLCKAANRLIRLATVAVVAVVLPICTVQMCDAQQTAQPTRERVYHFSARTTIIQKSDTLTLILAHAPSGEPGNAVTDTAVYLLGRDSSATQLRPKHRPMGGGGRTIWRLLTLAKRQEEVEKNLGISLHN